MTLLGIFERVNFETEALMAFHVNFETEVFSTSFPIYLYRNVCFRQDCLQKKRLEKARAIASISQFLRTKKVLVLHHVVML